MILCTVKSKQTVHFLYMCNDTVIISKVIFPLIYIYIKSKFKGTGKNKIIFILHWNYWFKQQSSITPLPSPLTPSLSPPLCACRHYLMSLSFCAAGVSGWRWCWWVKGLLLCETPANSSDSPYAGTNLSQSLDSLIGLNISHTIFIFSSPSPRFCGIFHIFAAL